MLVDLQTLDWDDDLLDFFGVDRVVLPRIVSSSERVVDAELLGRPFRSAAWWETSSRRSSARAASRRAKPRRRTGRAVSCSSASAPTGDHPRRLPEDGGRRRDGRAAAVCGRGQSSCGRGRPVAPATNRLVESASGTERISLEAGSSDGVYFVPALSGLGSPQDPDARGLITGLTRGTTRPRLVRAALEAVALQVADVSRRCRARSVSAPAAVARTPSSCSFRPTSSAARCRGIRGARDDGTGRVRCAGGARPRDVAGHGERREAPPARKAL